MHPTKEVIDSWPAPNFVNPDTQGPALTVVNIIFIILVFFVVGLRYYTRLRITRSFGQDDIVIGLSLVNSSLFRCRWRLWAGAPTMSGGRVSKMGLSIRGVGG